MDNSNIQIALYDDRLEITFPGGLARVLMADMIKECRSKPRNEALTSAFLYMKIVENQGSGIPRFISDTKVYGLREPEMIDSETDFRINIYRGQLQDNIDKATKRVPKKCRRY